MEEIQAFVADYRETWEQVMTGAQDVDALTPFFHLPCLMIGADGALSNYEIVSDLRAFNQSRLEAFKAGGATAAVLRGSDVQSLGDHLALAIVNWELQRGDGSTERAWRHYYSIRRTSEGCKILVSTFQVGS